MASPTSMAAESELAPFTVNFEVNFRGMNAGSASLG
jgi:hypothetical protein